MKKRLDISKLFRAAREERGSSLVEFAITAWLLILLLLGIYQCGYAMYAYHFTTYAAQQGARFAMVRGSTWSKDETVNCSSSAPPSFTMVYNCTAASSDIQNYVQSLATGGILASGLTVNTNNWPGTTPDCTSSCSACTTTNSQGCLVKVTVSYAFPAIPYLKISALSMSATSEKVILE
jgi:Flp pilus assembly protein TadG